MTSGEGTALAVEALARRHFQEGANVYVQLSEEKVNQLALRKDPDAKKVVA